MSYWDDVEGRNDVRRNGECIVSLEIHRAVEVRDPVIDGEWSLEPGQGWLGMTQIKIRIPGLEIVKGCKRMGELEQNQHGMQRDLLSSQ